MTDFVITIKPRRYFTPCQEMREQESNGIIGFHNFERCPNCKLESAGYELWGENGFLQGIVDNPTEEWKAGYIKRHSTPYTNIVFKQVESGYTYRRK